MIEIRPAECGRSSLRRGAWTFDARDVSVSRGHGSSGVGTSAPPRGPGDRSVHGPLSPFERIRARRPAPARESRVRDLDLLYPVAIGLGARDTWGVMHRPKGRSRGPLTRPASRTIRQGVRIPTAPPWRKKHLCCSHVDICEINHSFIGIRLNKPSLILALPHCKQKTSHKFRIFLTKDSQFIMNDCMRELGRFVPMCLGYMGVDISRCSLLN